jgi:hypothetical protein
MLRQAGKLLLVIGAVILLAAAGAPRAHADFWDGTCEQPARLTPGIMGRVTTYPDLPNRIRTYPSFSAGVVGHIPVGATFEVLSGPTCVSGTQWYQVRYNGVIGWTGEGNGYGTYWLEPYPLPSHCALASRLVVGQQGRVLPGLPNVIRTAPGTTATGANSQVIGEIPGGGVFTIHAGPQCGSDGRLWWQVSYNGLTGWTAEGEGYNTFWTEPAGLPAGTCPYALPARLSVGGWGRVTEAPYLPNRLRSTPGVAAGNIVGQIPAGGVFEILGGPSCGDGSTGTTWWYVSYNDVTGWTAEGNGSMYWLEPAW